jgi:MoaA/NifB/PqqE/SkfB family radical SAM enzyme
MEILPRAYSLLTGKLRSRKLSRWNSAGILLTYACSAECADCYENCSPRRRGAAPVDGVRECLAELKRLGCTGRDIHFGGGEPFYHYSHLIACFEAAKAEGMLPVGKLETNAFWCKNDELVRERLTEIDRFGIEKLSVSCDVFHQEFIPIERVRRAVRVGREVLGEKRVQVGLSEFFDDPIDVAKLTEAGKLEVFRDALQQRPWRITGRAAGALSQLLVRHPAEKFAGDHCKRKLLKKRSIHIDPHGNVFPSTCAGIVLGNARKQRLSELCGAFECDEHPVVRTLAEHGPVQLLEEAVEHGFVAADEGYATKCHLCFELRRFFWEQGLHADEVGPGEIYSN